MSQNADILKHLKEGKTITQMQALNLFGCFRLASRIEQLRHRDIPIKTDMIKENGKRFARYVMA